MENGSVTKVKKTLLHSIPDDRIDGPIMFGLLANKETHFQNKRKQKNGHHTPDHSVEEPYGDYQCRSSLNVVGNEGEIKLPSDKQMNKSRHQYLAQPRSRYLTQFCKIPSPPNQKKSPETTQNPNAPNLMMSCELNKLKIGKAALKATCDGETDTKTSQCDTYISSFSTTNILGGKEDIKIYRRSTEAIRTEELRSMKELERDVCLSYSEFNSSYATEKVRQEFPRADKPEPVIPNVFTLLDLRLRAVLAELRAGGNERSDLYGAVAKIRMAACVRVGALLLLPSIFADSHKTDKESATLLISAALCAELLVPDAAGRIGGQRGCSVSAAIKDCHDGGNVGTVFWDAVAVVECFVIGDKAGLMERMGNHEPIVQDLIREMCRRIDEIGWMGCGCC